MLIGMAKIILFPLSVQLGQRSKIILPIEPLSGVLGGNQPASGTRIDKNQKVKTGGPVHRRKRLPSLLCQSPKQAALIPYLIVYSHVSDKVFA